MLWCPIPRLWPNESVVIAASGPSLRKEDLDYVQGKSRLIVINNTYKLAPWADMLYACDRHWWEYHRPYFKGYKVGLWKCSGVIKVKSRPNPGLSYDPHYIHEGKNSGFQAINLAVHLGCNPIYLIGYDMQFGPGGETHWHGNHPVGFENPEFFKFRAWCRKLEDAALDLSKVGVQVVNCSRRTALTCFPRACIQEVL